MNVVEWLKIAGQLVLICIQLFGALAVVAAAFMQLDAVGKAHRLAKTEDWEAAYRARTDQFQKLLFGVLFGIAGWLAWALLNQHSFLPWH